MCGAPVVLEISNRSLCCKTTPVQFSRSVVSDSLRPHESQHARPPFPVTSIKCECFSVVCVCFICVLKKPLGRPEDWLNLIIMVLIAFEWQWWAQGRRESLAGCRNHQIVFLMIFYFFFSFEYSVVRFYHKTKHLETFNEMFENLSNWGKWTLCLEIVLFKEQ